MGDSGRALFSAIYAISSLISAMRFLNTSRTLALRVSSSLASRSSINRATLLPLNPGRALGLRPNISLASRRYPTFFLMKLATSGLICPIVSILFVHSRILLPSTFSSANTLGSTRLMASSKFPFLNLSVAIFTAYIGVDCPIAPRPSATISLMSDTEPVYLPDITNAPYSPAISSAGSTIALSAAP